MQTNQKSHRISLVIKTLLLGFGASLIVNFLLGNFLQLGYPFNTFFFRPQAKFRDFYFPYSISADPYSGLIDNTPTAGGAWQMPDIINGESWDLNHLGPVYFPFAYWIAFPFHLLSLTVGLLTFWIISFLIFGGICFKELRQHTGMVATVLICFLSYPFLFLLNRSNFEIFIFLFVYLFFLWYDRKPWLSASALGLATAMKFLPIAYVVLFLHDKKYKQALFTGGLAFIINVAGYTFYPGGLINNIRMHLFNLQISSLFYGLDGRDVAFNSNLASGTKYLFLLFSPRPDLEAAGLQAAGFLRLLIPLTAALGSGYCLFFEKVRWKQAAIITCLILLLPTSSADYRLLLMYLPFFLWLNTTDRNRFDKTYLILFAALFIPKSYLHLPVLPEISISVLINPVLMILVIGVIAYEKIMEFSSLGKTISQFWGGLANWQKYSVAIFSTALLFLSISSTVDSSPKVTHPALTQQLNILGTNAEKNQNFPAAIGYYGQWLALEPSNPEPRLGLARSLMQDKRYWEAYQNYKKAIWLAKENQGVQLEAERGIETALSFTVCDMMQRQELRWAKLIQSEYYKQFPDLPSPAQFRCASFME